MKAILASNSLRQAEELLGIDWDSCQRIMDRAVERGMARRSLERVRRVGLDEKGGPRRGQVLGFGVDWTVGW